MQKLFEAEWSPMVISILIAAFVAMLVSVTAGENIWAWTIPLGVAVGTAIWAGRQNAKEQEEATK